MRNIGRKNEHRGKNEPKGNPVFFKNNIIRFVSYISRFIELKRDVMVKRHLAEVCLRMSSYSGIASYRLLFMFFDRLTHFGCLLTFIR